MFDKISHDFKRLIYFITDIDHKEKAPARFIGMGR